jgi:hypothetical protein
MGTYKEIKDGGGREFALFGTLPFGQGHYTCVY